MRSHFVPLAATLALLPAFAQEVPIIETFAGGGPDELPALEANLPARGFAEDADGNLYVGTLTHIFRIDPGGHLRRLGGNGEQEAGGDGGPASAAKLTVVDLALDGDSIVFSDRQARGVRRIDLRTGIIDKVASVALGFGDAGLDVDTAGNIYLAHEDRQRVFRIDAVTGEATVVAGNGSFGFAGDGGPATEAALRSPQDVAVDAVGNLYVADMRNHRIRRVDASSGVITTIAGTGQAGFGGDGGPASLATLNRPFRLAIDADGSLLIVDLENRRVRRLDLTTGVITTVAGNGNLEFSGDGGPATAAGMGPFALAVGVGGDWLIGGNLRIRRVAAATGIIETIAGNGTVFFSGDGHPATHASLASPQRLTIGPRGDVYVADSGNHRVRRIDAVTGIITTVAGTGLPGSTGDGGPATDANVTYPTGVAVDPAGNLFVAESNLFFLPGGNRIRRIDARTGTITTVAGSGRFGFGGDGGPAIDAWLGLPEGLTVDAQGNLYLADVLNSRIRRVDAQTGIITTVAGNGSPTSDGDGGAATEAGVAFPSAATFDRRGNLYITERGSYFAHVGAKIRKVDRTSGIITTVAGSGGREFFEDGIPAVDARLHQPQEAVVDAAGNLYISDQLVLRIRFVDARTGLISTIAGGAGFGSGGDGGPALDAELQNPTGLALDARGRLYVTDRPNPRVRRIVFPNRAPIADAGPDQTRECAGPAGTVASLDGSESIDLDGDPLELVWTGPFREGGGTTVGERPSVTLAPGVAEIDLVADDRQAVSEPDQVAVTVEDTLPPTGRVTGPAEGSCHGPAALPVKIQDDFTDVCDADLARRYAPGTGALFHEHGDWRVEVTAADDAGNAVSDEARFTIDTVAPRVALLDPPDPVVALPAALPLGTVFASDDDDSAAGDVVYELVRLSGCEILDGRVFGDGDGLLADEEIVLDRALLCEVTAGCGFGVVPRPVLEFGAVDCGGNVGLARLELRGTLALRPGLCSGRARR